MKIFRALLLASLALLLLVGCSSETSDKTEKTEGMAAEKHEGPTAPGVTLSYTLVVSGFPMMDDMTFNYKFMTDGNLGKMSSESIIPAGDQVRNQKNSQLSDLETGTQTFMNDVTRTYATISFPDPSTLPPSTGPDAVVEIEKTGNTKDILGVPCEEINVTADVSRVGAGGTAMTGMTGTLWVSSDFDGFNLYHQFQQKMQEAIGQSRIQGSGYFEFLTRAGFTRANLNKLYNEIGGFPFEGSFELVINKGSDNATTITTAINVTGVSAGPIQQSDLEVPEDFTEVDLGQVNRPPGS